MRRILVRGADAQEFVKRAGEKGGDSYYSYTVDGIKYEIGCPLADQGYASLDTELRGASALILTAMSADMDETKYITDNVRVVTQAAPRLPIYVVSLAFRPLNTCTPEKLEYLLAEIIQSDSEFCELRVMTEDKTDISSLIKAIHTRISPTIPTLRTDKCELSSAVISIRSASSSGTPHSSCSSNSLRTLSSKNISPNVTPRSDSSSSPRSREGTPHSGTPPRKTSPRDDEREKRQSCTTQ